MSDVYTGVFALDLREGGGEEGEEREKGGGAWVGTTLIQSIKQFFINQHTNSNDTNLPTFRLIYSSLHQDMKTTQKQSLLTLMKTAVSQLKRQYFFN